MQRVILAIRPRHNDKINDNIANNGDSQNKAQSTKRKDQNLIDSKEEYSIDCEKRLEIDAITVIKQYAALLNGCIISLEDVYTTQFQSIQIVGRIAELQPMKSIDINDNYNHNDNCNDNDKDNENEEYEMNETYRGIVGLETEIYLILENSEVNFNLLHSPIIPPLLPHKDLIHVFTKDNEHFPVLRRLLRPCISLTSTVQKGKGIYNDIKHQHQHQHQHQQVINDNNKILNKEIINLNQEEKVIPVIKPYCLVENSNGKFVEHEILNGAHQTSFGNESNKNEIENSNENKNVINDNVSVDVDACTFDKVLLYLEHEVK